MPKSPTKRRINDGYLMAAKVVRASRRDSLKDFSRWKKAKNILVQSRWPRLREFIDFFTFSWCISFLRGNVDAAGFVQQLRNFHFRPAKGWSTEWDVMSFSCLKCYSVFHDAPTLDNLMEKSKVCTKSIVMKTNGDQIPLSTDSWTHQITFKKIFNLRGQRINF